MTAAEILTHGELIAQARQRGPYALPHHVVVMNQRALFQPPPVRLGHVLGYAAVHVDQLAEFVRGIETKRADRAAKRAAKRAASEA